jgi:hypothetical protein
LCGLFFGWCGCYSRNRFPGRLFRKFFLQEIGKLIRLKPVLDLDDRRLCIDMQVFFFCLKFANKVVDRSGVFRFGSFIGAFEAFDFLFWIHYLR